MGINNKTKICLVPHLTGIGGMVSFQQKLITGLTARGIDVTHSLGDVSTSSILIVGGTRQVLGLWRARRRGVRIIQRLNGMNWIHRVRPTGLRHSLRAEYGNFVLRFIRARLVDGVVYQSQFARQWWNRVCGQVEVAETVVHNGVDLQVYSPSNDSAPPNDRMRVLLVEGRLAGGYESGLENAILLVQEIKANQTKRKNTFTSQPVELTVVGRVDELLKAQWRQQDGLVIKWAGQVPHDRIPEIDRSAHMLFSADINAACPNSVIEALACGTPIVAFDTGALLELVNEQAGKIVPYGGNPWELEPPDMPALATAAIEVFQNQIDYRVGARQRAESAFSLDQMVEGYLEALLG
jgi:glycosyltransferase involved in cell wall biosynthesis